jgi:hypothetical protein
MEFPSKIGCQKGAQLNDTQHNDAQESNIQHKVLICDTQHKRH